MKVLSFLFLVVIYSVVWTHYTDGVVINALPLLSYASVILIINYFSFFKINWEKKREIVFFILSVIIIILLYPAENEKTESNQLIAFWGVILTMIIMFFSMCLFAYERLTENLKFKKT